MSSFSGMDIGFVEGLQLQLLQLAHQQAEVVSSAEAVATALGAGTGWTGTDAEQFRAALNDLVATLRTMPPNLESLAQNLAMNITAQKMASGLG